MSYAKKRHVYAPIPVNATRDVLRMFGDDQTVVNPSVQSASSVATVVNADNAKLAAGALGVFHGYRRSNGSLFWAAIYGLMAKWKPLYVVPVMVAQGVGRRKVWTTESGPR